MAVYLTDGLRHRIQRGDVVWDFAAQKAVPNDNPQVARAQYNYWLQRHAQPYVEDLIKPHRIAERVFYLRRVMVYLGLVIV